QESLDDGGARGGRAEAAVLHGLAQRFVVDDLARGFHRREQRGLGVARRGAGLPGDRRERAVERLALDEDGQDALVAIGGLGLAVAATASDQARAAGGADAALRPQAHTARCAGGLDTGDLLP